MHNFGRPEILEFSCPVCGMKNKKYIPIMYKNVRYGYALHCCNCGNVTTFISPQRSIGGLFNGQFMAGEVRDQRCIACDGCDRRDCQLHYSYVSDLMDEYVNDHGHLYDRDNLVPNGDRRPPVDPPYRPAQRPPHVNEARPPKPQPNKEYRVFIDEPLRGVNPNPPKRYTYVEPFPDGPQEASHPHIKTAYQDKRDQLVVSGGYVYPDHDPYHDLAPEHPKRRNPKNDDLYYGVYGRANNVNGSELEIKVGDPEFR